MSTQETGKFKLGTVNGTAVNTEHEYEFRSFASLEDAKASNDWNEKTLLDLVNSNENATARALAYQKAAKATGLMPDPEDPAVRRKKSIAALVSCGVPLEVATQTIDATLAAIAG